MNIWWVMLAGGLITFAIRFSFLAGAERLRLSPLLRRMLRLVPVAVFTALIVPDLLYRNGQLLPIVENQRLAAGLIAIGIAWFTRNTLLTIAAGMIVLVLLQIVMGGG